MGIKNCAALILSVLLAACGSGSGSGSAPPSANASPGGVWMGTDSTSGLAVEGVITEDGQAHFIRSDGAQFVVTVFTITGNSFSATFQGYMPVGSSWPDGSTHGTGTMTGTIAERQSIAASETFTTDAGSSTAGTLNLAFNSLYNVPSSLSTLSGNYTESSTGVVLSVSASGAINYQDPGTGCVLNGSISIIDPTYNAYDVNFTLANCFGAALDGVAFSGLATLDNSVTPNRLIFGVVGASGNYAIVDYFDRT